MAMSIKTLDLSSSVAQAVSIENMPDNIKELIH